MALVRTTRGPIFDLRLGSVELTHPTEHAGRAYGRIVGNAVAWLDLPDPPAPPEVSVREETSARPSQMPPPEPLQGIVYTPAAVSGEAEPAAARAAAAPAASPPSAAPVMTPAKTRLPRLLPSIA